MFVSLNGGDRRYVLSARFADPIDPLAPVSGISSLKPIALIASDENVVTAILKSMIAEVGYQVIEVKNASEAKKVLASHKVALIFSNIGVTGLMQLTSGRSSKGIPLVLMSKSDINEIRRNFDLSDLEIWAFIRKPITGEDFADAMRIANSILHPQT